jgi:hypothetical protein
MIGPCTSDTDNQTGKNFKSVSILLSFFTGLKMLSLKLVIWHLLIDSKGSSYIHMNNKRKRGKKKENPLPKNQKKKKKGS